MARYSPELLAALRHAYEKTDRPVRLVAADYQIGISTLQNLVETHGWAKRSQRTRDCPRDLQLLEAAKALATAQTHPVLDTLTGPAVLPAGETGAAAPDLSAADRLEALVVHEIAAEETVRARLGTQPRSRAESDRCARTLQIYAQTLRSLQQQREGRPTDDETTHDLDDDMPRDIDEFRRELARRIDAFVESRTDAADDDGGEDKDKPAGLDRA